MLTLRGNKKNCLQMLHDFSGIQLFPSGTNPREMQLTGFICGWFSSWQLVINLQAETEACFPFPTWFVTVVTLLRLDFSSAFVFRNWMSSVDWSCRRLSCHQAISESLYPLFPHPWRFILGFFGLTCMTVHFINVYCEETWNFITGNPIYAWS